jgi:signal transduction histidine kinase
MSSLSALLSRVRALDPRRVDLLLAVLVLVDTQIEAALLDVSGTTALAAHLIGIAAALVVLFHRRYTWAAFIGAQLLFIAGQATDDVITEGLVVPLFVFIFMNVSAAAQISGRAFWLVPAIAALGSTIALALDSYPDDPSSILWTLIFFAGATSAGGRLLDSRVRLSRALREKAELAASEEAARAENAMLDERARIAGELHDIIAHALSGMVVQGAAARRLVDTDPDRARDAFAAVEASGRDALGELRRLLGVLRREDEELALAPSPSLAHLDALVRRVTVSGLPVALEIDGAARPLPSGVDVTAYRVVQEALSAALELGGAGRATVRVEYRDGEVVVGVTDDGLRDIDDPRRLVGMRERVALFGGELVLSRPRDGGHVLRARLPAAAVSGAVA